MGSFSRHSREKREAKLQGSRRKSKCSRPVGNGGEELRQTSLFLPRKHGEMLRLFLAERALTDSLFPFPLSVFMSFSKRIFFSAVLAFVTFPDAAQSFTKKNTVFFLVFFIST